LLAAINQMMTKHNQYRLQAQKLKQQANLGAAANIVKQLQQLAL
jgi:hypothetical protein